ncbi:MAG: hypothetical protein FJ368_03110 [Pelagibacterales bacterium]|nr:hypothetical protein [Pelagibacterales bacterium]
MLKLYITKIFLILLFFSLNSFALTPEEHLQNEYDEQRARNLFLEVRCLVCSGQVIESSNTEFSFEMRKMIRNKIIEGKTDEEIKEDLVSQFGEDILTSAKLSKNNFLLWFLPLFFAIIPFLYLLKTKLLRNRSS